MNSSKDDETLAADQDKTEAGSLGELQIEETDALDKTELPLRATDDLEEEDTESGGASTLGYSGEKLSSTQDDDEVPVIRKKPPSWVEQSLYSARAFYFITYALYYYCSFKYPSQLSKAWKAGGYGYFCYAVGTHLAAIYFFLTTGRNPGWADEHQNDCVPSDDMDARSPLTMTINEKKEIVMTANGAADNHLKLSSEEEDSSDDEALELSMEASPRSAEGHANVEKRARAKKSRSKKGNDIEMGELAQDPIY